MKHRFAAAIAAAAITPALVVPSSQTTSPSGIGPTLPAVATAHRSWCHSRHSCPSDHATYTWRGKLCVKPTAEERTRAFKKKVRYGGLTYYCR
jgi:hypothetical protein